MIVCQACEAVEIVTAHKAGRPPLPVPAATHRCAAGPGWAVCETHAVIALVAGWQPVKIGGTDAT